MKKIAASFVVMLFVAVAAVADWVAVGPGVDYQQFKEAAMDVHVTRVDVTNEDIVVTSTRETERGMLLSDYARKNKALVAINGDYYDDKMKPIGLAIGPCGTWEGTADTQREGVVAIGTKRAAIFPQAEVMDKPEPWITAAVSGWPMIVTECHALTAKELPGSDVFTRAPHPRTAVGLSADGKLLYFVVADGRREGVPGLTLADLAKFMADKLEVCSAINFDGGGSSAMWVNDAIVNKPSDGSERRVSDHLAVLHKRDYIGCDLTRTNIAMSPDRGAPSAAATSNRPSTAKPLPVPVTSAPAPAPPAMPAVPQTPQVLPAYPNPPQ